MGVPSAPQTSPQLVNRSPGNTVFRYPGFTHQTASHAAKHWPGCRRTRSLMYCWWETFSYRMARENQRGQRIRMLGIALSLLDQKNTLRALLETLFHPRERHRTPILGRCLDNSRDTTLGERHTDIQRRTARYNLPRTHRRNEGPNIHV